MSEQFKTPTRTEAYYRQMSEYEVKIARKFPKDSDERLHHTLKAAYYEGVADAFAIIEASGRL